MKQVTKLAALTMLLACSAFLLAFNGNSEVTNETAIAESSGLKPEVGISITGKIARATTSRPRDGKNCGCSECFGVCDVEFDIDINPFGKTVEPGTGGGVDNRPEISNNIAAAARAKMFVKVLGPNQSEIYFMQRPTASEPQFGIDEDLTLRMNGRNVENVGGGQSLTLLKGEYLYTSETGTVQVNNGKYATYYGKVLVNSRVN